MLYNLLPISFLVLFIRLFSLLSLSLLHSILQSRCLPFDIHLYWNLDGLSMKHIQWLNFFVFVCACTIIDLLICIFNKIPLLMVLFVTVVECYYFCCFHFILFYFYFLVSYCIGVTKASSKTTFSKWKQPYKWTKKKRNRINFEKSKMRMDDKKKRRYQWF